MFFLQRQARCEGLQWETRPLSTHRASRPAPSRVSWAGSGTRTGGTCDAKRVPGQHHSRHGARLQSFGHEKLLMMLMKYRASDLVVSCCCRMPRTGRHERAVSPAVSPKQFLRQLTNSGVGDRRRCRLSAPPGDWTRRFPSEPVRRGLAVDRRLPRFHVRDFVDSKFWILRGRGAGRLSNRSPSPDFPALHRVTLD